MLVQLDFQLSVSESSYTTWLEFVEHEIVQYNLECSWIQQRLQQKQLQHQLHMRELLQGPHHAVPVNQCTGDIGYSTECVKWDYRLLL